MVVDLSGSGLKDRDPKEEGVDGTDDFTFGSAVGSRTCEVCDDLIFLDEIHHCRGTRLWKFCPHCGERL